MSPQPLVFAGTPEFARAALERLHAAGHPIALVLTQPDRPAGRGMALQASAVKQLAVQHGLPLAQPRSLKLDGKFPDDARAAQQALLDARRQGAVAMVVAAYGLILPQWVLDAFEAQAGLGCLNIHASLLPRWRGAAPIHRAIEAGDPETGITIMQMDAGLDTGDMLCMARTPIDPDDTTGQLHDRLAPIGGDLIVQALRQASAGGLDRRPQPPEGVTYAAKIDKAEAVVDWQLGADLVARRVRAFNPAPGASCRLRGEALKLWAVAAVDGPVPPGTPPGTVVQLSAHAIDVACGAGGAPGSGILRITELQRAGGKRLSAADFLRGVPLQVGEVLE
ncbi:MAG: hypothetical protein RLZZ126_534 [Pseudomonadota bacterium]